MLFLQDVVYTHPNGDVLFNNIQLTIAAQQKAGIVGVNGAGKSLLLQIIAGLIKPASGTVRADGPVYYVPQLTDQFSSASIAEVWGIEAKLHALQAILNGDVSEHHFTILNDDWSLEERCNEALEAWGLAGLSLDQPLSGLSRGQQTRVWLAGIALRQPALVLLDEPTNHLDRSGREQLYAYLRDTRDTVLVVSHDRTLLDQLSFIYELSESGLQGYGGNYSFYKEQKELEQAALQHELKEAEKTLRKAREIERETKERQQRQDARGKKKQEKAGLPTISMNTFRNNAEKSTARLKGVHEEKTGQLFGDVKRLREAQPDTGAMRLDFDEASMHRGKRLISAKDVQVKIRGEDLWHEPVNLDIFSGDRIAITGDNGSGKTTLLEILLDRRDADEGEVARAEFNYLYIDQDYSQIGGEQTVQQLASAHNASGLQPHELNSRLTHFLFYPEDWDKPCSGLSGGERMRLLLCCLTLTNEPPSLLVLDEPTNNLDLQNIAILTGAVKSYKGTLLIVSHDSWFLREVGVENEWSVKKSKD
jgi:ATPase subunit of ABC transporter with duplicated ATPase domains